MNKVKLNGKEYEVEVRNGVRYIDGKDIDTFLKFCNPYEMIDLIILGKSIVEGENIESPQKFVNKLNQKRNN